MELKIDLEPINELEKKVGCIEKEQKDVLRALLFEMLGESYMRSDIDFRDELDRLKSHIIPDCSQLMLTTLTCASYWQDDIIDAISKSTGFKGNLRNEITDTINKMRSINEDSEDK